MSSERHARAHELFEAASELAGPEREAFLAEQCAGDEELLDQVARLLALDAAAGTVALDTPAPQAIGAAGMLDALGASASAGSPAHPERIGEYRVLRELGSGGMGVVYEAEQEQPQRRVALKVLRPWLVEPALLRRFEHEAEVLGWLNHPGIAHVYEAGTADAGSGPQPWFAMELVRGSTLTQHADEMRLDARARIELVAKVCDAVHHAHQKGVVHRDLKPANVLVDETGQPKVLDFGIARVTDSDLRAQTIETRAGEILGTLSYMSPEQVSGDPSAVDTRTDVYALGVIAFELLTGALPHSVAGLPLPEAARRIQSDEPTNPSSLRRELRGDPETIVLKAIEKEKPRRYASAEELASDIRRFLADEPIVARPASAAYQLRKFARRNRALVAGVAGVVVALAIGLVVSTLLYLESEDRGDRLANALENETTAKEEAQEARDVARDAQAESEERRAALQVEKSKAEAALRDLRETQNYFDGLFASPMPFEDGADVRVVDVLERTAAGVDRAFPDRPLARARLLQRVGRTFQGIGLSDRSLDYLQRAAELYAEAGEPPSLQLVQLEEDLGTSYFSLTDFESGLEHHRRGLSMLSGLETRDRGLEMSLRHGVVSTLIGARRLDEARAEVESALDVILVEAPGDLGSRGSFRLSAAQIALEQGRTEDAEALGRAALADIEGSADPDRYQIFGAQRLIAAVALDQGRLEEALEFQELSYSGMRDLLGRDHMDLVMALQGIATIYQFVPDYERAEERYREALAMCARLIDPPSEPHGFIRAQYGRVLALQGKRDEAESELLAAISELRQVLDPQHYLLGVSLDYLGRLYVADHRPDEASAPLEEALEVYRLNFPPTNERILTLLTYLAQAYEEVGDRAGELACNREALDLWLDATGPEELNVYRLRFRIAAGLLATGDLDGARAEFEELWPEVDAIESPLDRATFAIDYGAFLCSEGDREDGERLIRDGLAALPPDGSFDFVERRAERHLAALAAADASAAESSELP